MSSNAKHTILVVASLAGIMFLAAASTAGIMFLVRWIERRRADKSNASQAPNKAGLKKSRSSEAPQKRRAWWNRSAIETPEIKTGITFDDVAGQQEAKLELKRVVNYLKNPKYYKEFGAKGFRGVLMFGPPGTGKTLIARAVAGEGGVNFYEMPGSQFVNKFVGTGAANIRKAFADARGDGTRPAILFIDEVDAVGGKRSEGPENGGKEYDHALTELLHQMSHPDNDNVVVIAATNRPDSLDPALMRGRRFGLQVPVGLPDIDDREAILRRHTKDMPLAKDVALRKIAELTPGLSGADLEEIANDAAMRAAEAALLAPERAGAEKAVTEGDLLNAVERRTIGHERKRVMSPLDKKAVADHEAGHALVAGLVPDGDAIRKVTIVPHGLHALGLVQTLNEEERRVHSKSSLEDRIAIALGGRVAEELTSGEAYSGAQNDLEQATRLARLMVMKLGMSEKVGHVSYDLDGERPTVGRVMSEKQKRLIEEEVHHIIREQTERVRKLLEDNRRYLDAIAAALMEKETLREGDIRALLPVGANARNRQPAQEPSGTSSSR